MKNKTKIVYLIVIIFVILMCSIMTSSNSEVRSIKSEKQLNKFYDRYEYNYFSFAEKLLLLPFSVFVNDYNVKYNSWNAIDYVEDAQSDIPMNDAKTSGAKDFSKTNIQVEGVDEADIIKTDGDYIYSISDKNVVITNVKKSNNIKIESHVSNGIPNDLIIYKDKLVVISSNEERSYYKNNTIVSIYDTTNKSKPKLLKSFELYEPYYTTRCIDGKLYVFSKGYLRKEDDRVLRDYKEDKEIKTISLNSIKYLKNNHSNIQTLIAEVDLNNLKKDLKLSSYLIDISNAYVSKKNIYLLDQKYDYNEPEIRDLFGIKGVFGLFDDEEDYGTNTHIYKFRISNGVVYTSKTKLEGSTVNQYSLDEKDGNLRVALEGKNGTRVAVLNSNLVEIGKTENVAKGEKMYSSRFIGDKAYLVTYQNTDPLFVIDLSNPAKPKVMGELKIPGYSTYLHPYDDTHLIGIGMETEEKTFRDAMGRVTSTTAVVTGMKMSLFDVSDINNPKQLAKTTIGDSRTVSAILTNPKALLFSKEKNLLAIPVNNYAEDFTSDISNEYEEEINNFTRRSENYVSEGYFVYKVNLKDGFNLQGVINHNKNVNDYYYYYYSDSRLLRGLYIDNNLFTVSEDAIKVHKLDNLEQVTELKLKGEKKNER